MGENPASLVYVNRKKEACAKANINVTVHALKSATPQEELNKILTKLSANPECHAILLQLPLPKHLNAREAIEHIAPNKDVDGLTVHNIGFLTIGEPKIIPCTPLGIYKILEYLKVNLVGKNVTVLGRSVLVGRSVSLLLDQKDATVTTVHPYTINAEEICKRSDILICATGHRHLVNKNYVKEGAVVIDVGIIKNEYGSITGDVDLNDVIHLCSYITPVPGGVGPMTIASLLENTMRCCALNSGKPNNH